MFFSTYPQSLPLPSPQKHAMHIVQGHNSLHIPCNVQKDKFHATVRRARVIWSTQFRITTWYVPLPPNVHSKLQIKMKVPPPWRCVIFHRYLQTVTNARQSYSDNTVCRQENLSKLIFSTVLYCYTFFLYPTVDQKLWIIIKFTWNVRYKYMQGYRYRASSFLTTSVLQYCAFTRGSPVHNAESLRPSNSPTHKPTAVETHKHTRQENNQTKITPLNTFITAFAADWKD